MSKFGRTSVLIALSVVYLTFELAFNARLLDVVGSAASPGEVHTIEVYGRTLSGLAAALVVLSILWKQRAAPAGNAPAWPMILVACTLTVGAVFFALETLVNYVARQSSAEFRRTSMNILLLQNALAEGKAELDGLTEHPELFATPQGKAFLALFPAMAVSVDRLDEKIRPVKLSLIERKLRKDLGGVNGFHERYQDGVDKIRLKFQDYRRLPTVAIDVDEEVRKQQDKAWEDYLRDLGQRGWTPSTIPPGLERRVVAQVRKKGVQVPDSWSPSDEAGFRAAVESQTRRRLAKAPGADGVMINGRKVAPGLDWIEFFAQEAVQAELRRQLGLPPGARLLPTYENAAAFDKAVFRPMVAQLAARELRRYEAPVSTFGPGGPNEAVGLEAARAVVVPPIALLFSLLGATLHLAKIFFLVHQTVRQRAADERPQTTFWQGMALCSAVVAVCLVSLRVMDNDITRSNLYVVMNAQLLDEPSLTRQMVSHSMHVIAVGQAFTYPINEAIRTRLLGGITYGYKGKTS
jgi:hypothetical protein